MIDLVIRPFAGLLLCLLLAALVLSLPTIVRHVRAWAFQIRQGNLPAPVLSMIRQREDLPEPESERKAS